MQAIILAAGMGLRLRHETLDKPKCMVEVSGASMLRRSLDALSRLSVSRIILVSGYRAEAIRRLAGDSYNGIPVVHIENAEYGTTNNIYSLYLARNLMAEDDTLLLESDIVYDPSILEKLVADAHPNVAVVDKYRPRMDGTVVKISAGRVITAIVPKAHFDPDDAENYYKTVNIYKFSRDFSTRTYIPFLEAYCATLGRILSGTVGIFHPTFVEYPARLGDRVVRLRPGKGLRYDADDLIRAADKANCLLLVNPDNPSGNFIPKPDLLKAVAHCGSLGKRVIVDESFVDFADGGGGNFEVVVVDNGSTDGSREICGEYARLDPRIRLFSLTENVGAGAARNFALDRARGDAAVFVDAAYPPPNPSGISISGPPQGKMSRSGLIDIVDVAGRPRVRYWTPCGSSLVSLDVIRRHGVRFNERMRQGEDGWFMLRLAKIPVSYHYSDTVVYNWRRHGYNSITLTSLHPLERIACKCFFYAELRKFLRGQVGISLADRAVAHNYVSVFLEMLLLYGAWGVGADSSPAAAGILRALDDPFLRAGLDDYTPGRWVDLFAKAFAQFGWADALALLGRRYAAGAAGDWRDFSDFEYRRIVGADYGS